jgi:hypothetical protein
MITSEQSALGSLVLVFIDSLIGEREKKRWKKFENEVRYEKDGALGVMCDNLHGIHVRVKLLGDAIKQADRKSRVRRSRTWSSSLIVAPIA